MIEEELEETFSATSSLQKRNPFYIQNLQPVINFLKDGQYTCLCLLCGCGMDTTSYNLRNENLSSLKYKLGSILGLAQSYLMSSEEKVTFCDHCLRENIQDLLNIYTDFQKTREQLKNVSTLICCSILSTHRRFEDESGMKNFLQFPVEILDNEDWELKRITKMLTSDFVLNISKTEAVILKTVKPHGLNFTANDQLVEDSNTVRDEPVDDVKLFMDCDNANLKLNSSNAEKSKKMNKKLKAWKSNKLKTLAKKTSAVSQTEEVGNGEIVNYSDKRSINHLTCTECGKCFQSAQSMKSHKRVHIRENKAVNGTYNCTHCRQTFSSLEFLYSHKEIHDAERNFCTICNKQFSKGLLYEHLHSHFRNDLINSNPICKLCSKTFETPVLLANHMNVHKGDFSCIKPSCRKSFYSEKSLQQHEKLHLDGSMLHDCDYCSKFFENQNECDDHVSNHKKIFYEKKFLCDNCGQYFLTNLSLRRHARHAHKDSGKFKCEICNNIFKTSRGLTTHKKSHNPDPLSNEQSIDEEMQNPSVIKRYRCPHCENTRFSYKQGLRQHIYKYHPDEYSTTKQFICTVCYKNFTDESSLEEHSLVHERLKCKICNKQFKMMTHLKEHIIRHATIRPYKCPFCPNKGYVRNKELTDHLEKIHPSETANSAVKSESITYMYYN